MIVVGSLDQESPSGFFVSKLRKQRFLLKLVPEAMVE